MSLCAMHAAKLEVLFACLFYVLLVEVVIR